MIDAAITLASLCIPVAVAGVISAHLSRTSREEWALLAWVPPLPLFGFALYVGILQFGDWKGGNLWPIVLMFLIAVTGILFVVFVIARRVFGSNNPGQPYWRRARKPTE